MLEPDPKKRWSIPQIYQHEWLSDIDDQSIYIYIYIYIIVVLFNVSEKEQILREFFRPEESSMEEREKETDRLFTEQNIDNSTTDLMKNISLKSIILAPFNSTQSDQVLPMSSLIEDKIWPKHKMIKFALKCKDIDRQYEKNNNSELDNGVYNRFVGQDEDEEGESGSDNEGEENGGGDNNQNKPNNSDKEFFPAQEIQNLGIDPELLKCAETTIGNKYIYITLYLI